MIKKYALMFLLLASSGFCAKGAFSPIQSLPNNYNGGILENISSTYISKHDKVFLVWGDSTNSATSEPWYAIYNCKNSTFSVNPSPAESGYFIGIDGLINACYNPKNDFVFFSWGDENLGDSQLRYKIYDCKNDTFLGDSQIIEGSVFYHTSPYCSYNSYNNSIFLTWSGKYNYPYYAIFDCNTMEFSTPPTKLLSGQEEAYSYVTSGFNPKTNQYIIGWCDHSSQFPFYTIFDGTASSQTLSAIPVPNPQGYKANMLLGSLISKNNQFFAITWDNTSNQLLYGIYDFINASFTTAPQPLGDLENFAPYTTYLPHNNSLFIFLSPFDFLAGPSYAIFDCTKNSLTTDATLIDPNFTGGCKGHANGPYISKHNSVFIDWVIGSQSTGEYCMFHELNERTKQLILQSPIYFEKGTR